VLCPGGSSDSCCWLFPALGVRRSWLRWYVSDPEREATERRAGAGGRERRERRRREAEQDTRAATLERGRRRDAQVVSAPPPLPSHSWHFQLLSKAFISSSNGPFGARKTRALGSKGELQASAGSASPALGAHRWEQEREATKRSYGWGGYDPVWRLSFVPPAIASVFIAPTPQAEEAVH